MKKRWLLILGILLLFVALAASFAATQTSESVNLTITSSSFAEVTAVGGAGTFWKYGVAHAGAKPVWTPLAGTSGSITAGDLYYVDPGDYEGDLLVMLYLTNVGDLAGSYSFLNMKVEAWEYTDAETDTWVAKSIDQYLTMSNGYVAFILPKPATGYVITIDDGSWYCISASGTLAPSFFIDVRQA